MRGRKRQRKKLLKSMTLFDCNAWEMVQEMKMQTLYIILKIKEFNERG